MVEQENNPQKRRIFKSKAPILEINIYNLHIVYMCKNVIYFLALIGTL